MALGRAVVTSDLGPRRGVVRNGETGLLYEPGNAEDLREKLLYMIGNPNREAYL